MIEIWICTFTDIDIRVRACHHYQVRFNNQQSMLVSNTCHLTHFLNTCEFIVLISTRSPPTLTSLGPALLQSLQSRLLVFWSRGAHHTIVAVSCRHMVVLWSQYTHSCCYNFLTSFHFPFTSDDTWLCCMAAFPLCLFCLYFYLSTVQHMFYLHLSFSFCFTQCMDYT